MKRKAFLVLILLCILGLSTAVASPPTPYIPPPPPSTPAPPSTPPAVSTVYVYPHSYGLAPNQQIQSDHPLMDALKLAKPGWEIFLNSGVYNGTYTLATEDIRLVGNNATINGSITISAPGIKISNISIVYMPYEGEDHFRSSDVKSAAKVLPYKRVSGAVNVLSNDVVIDSIFVNTNYVGVYIAASHVTVKNSKIIATDFGIQCSNSNDVLISNNLIEPSEIVRGGYTGIDCYNCSAVIAGDTIKRMEYGVKLESSYSFYAGTMNLKTKASDVTSLSLIPSAKIERCTFGECSCGVYTYAPATIEQCNFYSDSTGICISGASNVTVKQCSFYLGSRYDVYLVNGANNFTIVGNKFTESIDYTKAIYLDGRYNMIKNGSIDGNIINCTRSSSAGIYLLYAENVTVSNNFIEHIRVYYSSSYVNAITVQYSSRNKIVNNTISDILSYSLSSRSNSGNAICLYQSNYNLVSGNIINDVKYAGSSGSDSAGAGILVNTTYYYHHSYGSGNTISSNRISNVVFGIREYNEKFDTISDNVINNACVGIWLDQNVHSTKIDGNYISSCTLWTQHIPEGMHISAEWAKITNNTITDCYRGINLRAAQYCTLKGNLIKNCQDGLRLESSSRPAEYNKIYENVFDNAVNIGTCNLYYNTWSTTVGNYWSDYKSKYPDATVVGMFYSQPYIINPVNIDYKPVVSPEYLSVPNNTPLPTPTPTSTPVAVNNPQSSLTKVQIFNKIMDDIGAYTHATNPSTKAKIFNEILSLIKLYAS